LLRSVAKYPNLEALRQRPLTDNVVLADVATIRYAEPERRFYARANSKPAYFCVILKESEANALEVSDRIEAAVERMRQDPRLALLSIDIFFNQGKTILESLGILLDSGRIGAIFAAFVLFFFLRRFRMTVIIALSIPLSLFIGLTAMYFFGETLNIISLLALMISVGLLVDNSVVVAENIFRLHQAGASRREACIRGAGEISLAIVMATLTTVIVFLPVSLVGGQMQFFLLRLSIPITVSLIASLLVALVFVPLSVYLTLDSASKGKKAHHLLSGHAREVLRHLYEATFGRMNRLYNSLLAIALRRRMDLVMAMTAVVILTAVVPMKAVKVAAVQEDERGGFEVDVILPPSTTLEESTSHFRRVEKIIEDRAEEWDLQTYLVINWSTGGEVQGWFNTPRNNEVTANEVVEQLVELMPERAGSKLYTGLQDEDEDEKKDLQTYYLVGDDPAELETVAEDLTKLLTSVRGVVGVKQNEDEPGEEMAIKVDRERAQRLDINPEVVAGVVRNSIGGRSLPKFYREGREIPVRVRYQESDRESLDQLQSFLVPTNTGEFVSLASVTRSERLDTAGRIFRTNKQVSRSITLQLEEGDEKATRERLSAFLANVDLPEGARFGNPRNFRGADDELQSMMFAAA
ncbi:MAG: efflux RND transporter permease subunit, partial [Holophagales bacterium]|nr:efflux RND transporter permease subunit [Holophagales bacterium]